MRYKPYINVLLFTIGIGLLLQLPRPAYAQTYNSYIWEYIKPTAPTNTNDLKTRLEEETQKIINAGHLLPLRTVYGKEDVHFHWYHKYDTIYTLSLIYPYISPNLQQQIVTYLQSELQSQPLWTKTYWDTTHIDYTLGGSKRQNDSVPSSQYNQEISNRYYAYRTRPDLFALYALWLYAQNTGDWSHINNSANWNAIKSFYTNNSSEINSHYTSIAGAIGYVRMAHQRNPQDISARDAGITAITNGLNNGKSFTTFAQNAQTAYMWGGNPGVVNNYYMGFQFLDITPEIGRYFFDDASLKSSVLGTTDNNFSLARAESRFNLWFLPKAPYYSLYYGEDSGLPPETKAMIFPIKAWVQKEPASKLRQYLTYPDAAVGDYYYLQNIVRTIEASGTECWENIQTSTQECVSSTSSPTPTPKPGDVDGNGSINLTDLSTLLSNFGKNGMLRINGDLTGEGSINLTDLSQLLANFGK